MSEKILTPEQVADYLQLHPLTVLKMIRDKKLKACRIGRVYRVFEQDLADFLKQAKV